MVDEVIRIFIVEDDPWYGEFLEAAVQLFPNVEVRRFSTANSCIEAIQFKPALVTLDYRLPDMEGKDALMAILEKDQKAKVVVVSAQEDIETAVDLLKHGAYDYLVKNDQTRDRLWNIVKNLIKEAKLERENQRLKEELLKSIQPVFLIGKDANFKRAKSIAEKAAKSGTGILIFGPSGTGKKTMAKYIHQQAGLASQPFQVFSPIGLSEEQCEQVLFGRELISSIGIQREAGLLVQIGKGTLLIEHFERLSASILEQLAQIQRSKHFYSKGSNYRFEISGRLLFSSQTTSEKWMQLNPHVADLLFTLTEMQIELPPLVQRKEDIELLANWFIEQSNGNRQNGSHRFSKKAMEKLQSHHFPGNLRELKAIIDLAIVLSKDLFIEADDIVIQSQSKQDTQWLNEEKSMEEYQKDIVFHYLDKYQQKVLVVADKLQVSKSSIYNLLKRERGSNNE
ncbi:MAG: sigma-54-dependent Fis family transcriptional regulator [Bacteroidetes bacterium]|nr:sigma-54-dependent Fis family transcriptional regulator [Bacteroidota bacterium]